MMPKFSTIKAGDVLYDVNRYKMGNTTMSSVGAWDVRVLEALPDRAIISDAAVKEGSRG